MTKYKIGDLIRVKSRKEIKQMQENKGLKISFTEDMFCFCGEIFIIKEIGTHSLNLENATSKNGYNWCFDFKTIKPFNRKLNPNSETLQSFLNGETIVKLPIDQHIACLILIEKLKLKNDKAYIEYTKKWAISPYEFFPYFLMDDVGELTRSNAEDRKIITFKQFLNWCTIETK